MNKVLFLMIVGSALAQTCQNNDDCPIYNTCDQAKCIHKDLWPLNFLEISGFFLILVISALSNAVGIGGGILSILVLQSFVFFDTYYAVPLCQVISFGGSLMSVSLKIPLRHPVKDRPLIDYELFSYILSPILGGTTIGVILHLIFPNWITILCLCLLSGYVCFSMFKKGLNLHRIETNSRQVFKETENGFKIIKETNEVDDNSARDVILSNLFEIQEKKIMPLGGVLQILGIFVIVVLGAFIKGGKGIDSILGLEECSTSFWVFISTYLVSYMLITFYTGRQMIVKTQQKTQVNYDFDDADVRWNKDNTLKIGLIAVMTGVAAGALGIGGGIIMNPVLLSIGLRPEVCTATSSFVIVFATSVSVIQFIVSGIINFWYGFTLFLIAIIGGFTGTSVIKRLVDKQNRPSIIVLLLGFMTGLSCISLTTTGIFTIIAEAESGSLQYGFTNFCSK